MIGRSGSRISSGGALASHASSGAVIRPKRVGCRLMVRTILFPLPRQGERERVRGKALRSDPCYNRGAHGNRHLNSRTKPMTVDPRLLSSLQWRLVGPFRGGRSVAVAGDPVAPNVFYFGACAGGVWKTTDGGAYWENVSDGFF